MVNGIQIFRDYFKDYTENYILIGGAACDQYLGEAGLTFRATKDLDIVLVVEAMNIEFLKIFWDFVKEGNYQTRQKSSGERKYYRFFRPENKAFPYQLELFARQPDIMDPQVDTHLTPIPADKDLSSLSAILMDEDYYGLTLENSKTVNGIHMAGIETLICLKAKAFLDLHTRRGEGEKIDSRTLRKHKNDVIRLAVMLTGESVIDLPASIASDMRDFLEAIQTEPPDYKMIGKNTGIPGLNGEDIVGQIKHSFSLI